MLMKCDLLMTLFSLGGKTQCLGAQALDSEFTLKLHTMLNECLHFSGPWL